jgi:transcriptional regulator with XRE-family HTH domain
MKRPQKDLLSQEREVEELLRRMPPEVIGARLCRARKRQGLSVRDLAAAAQVNKNSVTRLENGGAPQPMTVLKLCTAMGIHVATIAQPETGDGQAVSVHRREEDRWYDLEDLAAGPLAPSASKKAKMLLLKNRLETGRILARVLELTAASEPRSHIGEELVYVLKGKLRLTVGDKEYELEEGESATFWSSEEHSYAPAGRLVRFLSVTEYHGPRESREGT